MIDKQSLIDYAKSLGFLDLRIAKAEPLTKEMEHYNQWIESGYHATMKWMERNLEKRVDISNVLPNAKSVLVLSHSYYTNNDYPDNLENAGKISRYAWGDDYHDVLLEKLKKIESFMLESAADLQIKSYVDTGPILERQWAVKSGIGWQGKNGMIINPKYGSYFFIAIMITDVEFEYDEPIQERCGKCTACIENCPTGAIIMEKVVDSNKCLSYWTIESKDNAYPTQIKENQQNWYFGCDICQEVCPWNRFSKLTDDEAFQPRNGETIITNQQILDMDNIKFNQRFKNSPIKRTKLSRLIKNIV